MGTSSSEWLGHSRCPSSTESPMVQHRTRGQRAPGLLGLQADEAQAGLDSWVCCTHGTCVRLQFSRSRSLVGAAKIQELILIP